MCILLWMNLFSTEPNSYVKTHHHGLPRPNQQNIYNNSYSSECMMPSTSASPAQASYNQGQWASLHYSNNPGTSNGAGMSQVNPVIQVPPSSGETGNLPLLNQRDLDFLNTSSTSATQPQLEHSVQHSQQPLHRKETMPAGETIWQNYHFSQAQGTQNGTANPGMIEINYTYPNSQDGSEIFNTLVGSQTSHLLKQEPQGQSTLPLMESESYTFYEQSNHMLNYPATNSSNLEAMRHAASSGSNGQRNTQNPSYSMNNVAQETQVDPISWAYSQFGGE